MDGRIRSVGLLLVLLLLSSARYSKAQPLEINGSLDYAKSGSPDTLIVNLQLEEDVRQNIFSMIYSYIREVNFDDMIKLLKNVTYKIDGSQTEDENMSTAVEDLTTDVEDDGDILSTTETPETDTVTTAAATTTTVEELDPSTTVQPTTTVDAMVEFCKTACSEGAGGPECNCPGHPVG